MSRSSRDKTVTKWWSASRNDRNCLRSGLEAPLASLTIIARPSLSLSDGLIVLPAPNWTPAASKAFLIAEAVVDAGKRSRASNRRAASSVTPIMRAKSDCDHPSSRRAAITCSGDIFIPAPPAKYTGASPSSSKRGPTVALDQQAQIADQAQGRAIRRDARRCAHCDPGAAGISTASTVLGIHGPATDGRSARRQAGGDRRGLLAADAGPEG